MTRVKICGLTREEDVDAAVDAGADAVGFISGIPSSPRNLSISRAASLISRVPPFVTSVLVTSGQGPRRELGRGQANRPRAIQLYARASSRSRRVRGTFHAYLLRPFLWAGKRATKGSDVVPKAREAARGYDALLTDTYQKGRDGGTGLTSDWSVCAEIRKTIAPTPMILSGGLRPENVELAIASVAPYCVDVSSGVESAPGRQGSRQGQGVREQGQCSRGEEGGALDGRSKRRGPSEGGLSPQREVRGLRRAVRPGDPRPGRAGAREGLPLRPQGQGIHRGAPAAPPRLRGEADARSTSRRTSPRTRAAPRSS